MTNHCRFALVITMVGFAWISRAQQMPFAAPEEIQGPEILDAILLVKPYTDLGLSPDFTVEGERVWDKPLLAADVITFQRGSKLLFSSKSGDRGQIYIVARELRVTGDGPAPVVGWVREDLSARVPLEDAKAPWGSVGGGPGAAGSPGADGQTGNPGYPGRSGPTVYVFSKTFSGGPITVDLKGQDGGLGGKGQAGGDGGPGRAGEPAVQGFIDCSSGGGDGGNGGKGGNGGQGGSGGRGGNGGMFFLITVPSNLPTGKKFFQVDARAGNPGKPGQGGQRGTGGKPGPGASGRGRCGGGRPGSPGPDGADGAEGANTSSSPAGSFFVTTLTDQQAKTLRIQ